jgi:hypothetical protein
VEALHTARPAHLRALGKPTASALASAHRRAPRAAPLPPAANAWLVSSRAGQRSVSTSALQAPAAGSLARGVHRSQV